MTHITLPQAAWIVAALAVLAFLARAALVQFLDWNLHRKHFLRGSDEPTSIHEYLHQREAERTRARRHYSELVLSGRASLRRHRSRALPHAGGRVEPGVRESGPRSLH